MAWHLAVIREGRTIDAACLNNSHRDCGITHGYSYAYGHPDSDCDGQTDQDANAREDQNADSDQDSEAQAEEVGRNPKISQIARIFGIRKLRNLCIRGFFSWA